MHRTLAAMLLGTSSMLIAAAPPSQAVPSPSAQPSAVVSPLPSRVQTPLSQSATVLIYPFDVQTGVNAKIGTAIAEILAQEMAAAGGLNVLPVPQGIKRADFLNNAREQKADFYISGYVTPVGDAAAVVEQVVGVDSGVILFSQTAQVQSVADVASQSLQARAQILAFVNRATQSIAAESANTPAPAATNGTNVKLKGLNSIVDAVFHHKGAAASPAPAQKPERGVIVAPVTPAGAISTADAARATNELFSSLGRHYRTQLTANNDVAGAADAICGPDRNNTIATGTLSQTPGQHGSHMTFTLSVYTCFGAELGHAIGSGGSMKQAVDAAVTTYAASHPENS